ncbi:hypothetical protein [Enterobacter hormaechei]|uniref:hypothetical protein n=1 Tax=Enterobacter hormaechei TaxID=158836 RepID=UPI003CF10403
MHRHSSWLLLLALSGKWLRMVQSYQEMSERLQMATSSQEEFQSVQKRLLNTANDTKSFTI